MDQFLHEHLPQKLAMDNLTLKKEQMSDARVGARPENWWKCVHRQWHRVYQLSTHSGARVGARPVLHSDARMGARPVLY